MDLEAFERLATRWNALSNKVRQGSLVKVCELLIGVFGLNLSRFDMEVQ